MHTIYGFWKTIQHLAHIIWYRLNSDLSLLRASSLSFQSVFTIVPLFAVMFGIAKGFGLELLLQNTLREEFRDQQEMINYFMQFSDRLLEQTRGGLIAGIGIIILLFTVMRLFSNVENTLNAMWGVKSGRTLIRKASDYLALILICPIMIVASSSMTVFITTKLHQITEQIGPYVLYLIPLLPYFMSTLLFSLIYIIMPNTYVRLRSSILAGLFAGIAYQVLQATYISIQIKVSNAGAIYGSFAALPLFFMWLYLSWVLFLIGAHIVVIHQERLWNRHVFAPFRELTIHEKTVASLACVKACIDAYSQAVPISIEKLSFLLGLPEKVISEIVDDLESNNIVYKTTTQTSEGVAIIPAISPDKMKLFDVILATSGTSALTGPLVDVFDQTLLDLLKEQQNSPANLLIRDVSQQV